MCSPCGSRAAFQRLLVADALALLSVTAEAAKVELDPSNWGDEAGQDCVSCHTKSSPGLTQQWQESAHASGGVNCMDCLEQMRPSRMPWSTRDRSSPPCGYWRQISVGTP
jgi:hypothetical protein